MIFETSKRLFSKIFSRKIKVICLKITVNLSFLFLSFSVSLYYDNINVQESKKML